MKKEQKRKKLQEEILLEKNKNQIEQQRRSKQDKGITLVALVVTIIILLILAGVTLNGALSENGLFRRAKYAVEEYNKKSIEEDIQLWLAGKEMDGGGPITDDDIKELQDSLEKLGKKIIGVPDAETFKKIGTDKTKYPLDGIYVQTGNFELTNPPTMKGSENEYGSLISDNSFKGVYYGNGYIIQNLEITDEDGCAGMFGVNEGTIKDVKIENCNIAEEQKFSGSICAQNYGLIEGCLIESGSIKGYNVLGGICGNNAGTIKDCENKANVNGTDAVGGIAGASAGGIIEMCINNGNIEGCSNMGGIAGYRCRTQFCENNGKVKVVKGDVAVQDIGGIVGELGDGEIVFCINNGAIEIDNEVVSGQNLGGLTGSVSKASKTSKESGTAKINMSINNVDINGLKFIYIGGICRLY